MILAGLAALGLSFLRTDAILLPIMGISLLIALWGFWSGRQMHGESGPFALAIAGTVALVAGVVFVHGMPARVLIGIGAFALVIATVWNVGLRGAQHQRP